MLWSNSNKKLKRERLIALAEFSGNHYKPRRKLVCFYIYDTHKIMTRAFIFVLIHWWFCKYNKFENWLYLFSRSTFIRTSEWILVFGQLIWNFIEKLKTKIGLPSRNHHNCSTVFTPLNACCSECLYTQCTRIPLHHLNYIPLHSCSSSRSNALSHLKWFLHLKISRIP